MLQNNQSIDQNARNIFLTHAKSNGFALVSDIENTYHATPLTSQYEKFKRGKAGPMVAARASALKEAAQIKNAAGRLLSFFVALGRQGFKGTCVPQELLGEAVSLATGKSTKERSIRAAQRALAAGGWITVHYTPTGTKTQVEPGLWRSLRICQITFTEQTKILCRSHLSHNSLPRQKLPAMVCQGNQGERKRSFPPGLPRNEVTNIKESLPVSPAATMGESDVPPTPLARPAARPTIEHKPMGDKPAKGVGCFARRKRNRSPRTWDANRILFLRELGAALVGDNQGDRLYHLAKVQTHKNFPPLIPTALDSWERFIFCYHENDKRNRRRQIKQEIIPALAAFAVGIFPPDTGPLYQANTPPATKADIERHLAAFERLQPYHGSISKRIIWGEYPDEIKQFARDNAGALDTYPRMIQSGKIELEGVPYETRAIFRQLADLTNQD